MLSTEIKKFYSESDKYKEEGKLIPVYLESSHLEMERKIADLLNLINKTEFPSNCEKLKVK